MPLDPTLAALLEKLPEDKAAFILKLAREESDETAIEVGPAELGHLCMIGMLALDMDDMRDEGGGVLCRVASLCYGETMDVIDPKVPLPDVDLAEDAQRLAAWLLKKDYRALEQQAARCPEGSVLALEILASRKTLHDQKGPIKKRAGLRVISGLSEGLQAGIDLARKCGRKVVVFVTVYCEGSDWTTDFVLSERPAQPSS